ncbi:MAG: hypothetical protein ACXVCM_03590 [Ktedonobacteraceae bacterium]
MYYRVAIQVEPSPLWQWKSTVLSSLDALFQFLRLYRALPQDHLRVFSSSSQEGLKEQFVQENKGLGSNSVTAAQFLQERMLHSTQVTGETSERREPGVRENQGRTPIAVTTNAWLNESSKAAGVLYERTMSSLDRRRLEVELGVGGDHDVPYVFALPPSMPQVLAWMRLLTSVHRGKYH